MPLYVNLTGTPDGEPEIRRTIPGHAESEQCEQSPNWQRISEAQLAELRAGADPAEVLAEQPADPDD